MTGYYENEDKITFDEADTLVDRYISRVGGRRSRVTSKDVAREFDIEQSHHNLIRLTEALGKRLEISRDSGSKVRQFKLKNNERTHSESSSE